ncbi:hypothetical protein KPL70_015458 [Citrus sinensis]|nr:hypothetical protein KPL70_015458 [Citrus sinensis]
MDIVHALAYLHFGFPRPIVFRNFKTSCILFNEENVAKLFDFSLSISIPEGETHITDTVMGTLGYCAPEYMRTGVFNEKSNVFSFSVFLFELLTGWDVSDLVKDVHDLVCPFSEYLKNCFEDNRFTEIVDHIVVEDVSSIEKEQQLHASAQVTFECIKDSPADRPSMVDVAKKLRQIYRSLSCETNIDGVKETSGIVVPEYACTCHFNEKCDVHSFGLLLLQLLSTGEDLSIMGRPSAS